MCGLGYTCDYDDQEITGELFESRIPNPGDPTDMVCVMYACAAHAEEMGAKSAAEWDRWLQTEGGACGYVSLS
jgi:hypothetical protein